MSEPVAFPVPADDLRFLERLARERAPPRARDSPRPAPLGTDSVLTLRGYVSAWRRQRGREVRQWGQPVGRAKVVCVGVGVASAVLAVELIYFIACRPDVRGRRIRARLITPRDVQRIVYLRLGTARGLLNRVRM